MLNNLTTNCTLLFQVFQLMSIDEQYATAPVLCLCVVDAWPRHHPLLLKTHQRPWMLLMLSRILTQWLPNQSTWHATWHSTYQPDLLRDTKQNQSKSKKLIKTILNNLRSFQRIQLTSRRSHISQVNHWLNYTTLNNYVCTYYVLNELLNISFFYRPLDTNDDPNHSMIDDAPLTFEIFEKGSLKGKRILVSSDGHSYVIKVRIVLL